MIIGTVVIGPMCAPFVLAYDAALSLPRVIATELPLRYLHAAAVAANRLLISFFVSTITACSRRYLRPQLQNESLTLDPRAKRLESGRMDSH